MNRSFLLEASLCLCVMLSTAACGRRVAAASAGDSDTGPHPATVEPDMDANNFKVDHPEQFPLARAGEYAASPELNVTGVVSPDVSRQVPVPSLASGRVVEIDARLGDEVKQGQLLFKVRSTDIAGAFSDYQKAVRNEQLAADPTESRQTPVRQRGHSQERPGSGADHRGQRQGGSGNDHGTPALAGGRSRASDRNRRGPRSGFGSDYRPANHQLLGRAGPDGAQPVHHLRRVARVDCVRCIRKRFGAGASWRVRGYPSECLSEPAPERADRQHRANHGPEPSNGEGAPGSGESRPDALRDVCYGDVPRSDHGEARHRAGHGDPALARPRLGLYASRTTEDSGVSKWPLEKCSPGTCRKSLRASSRARRWWPMPWSCKTPWSNR